MTAIVKQDPRILGNYLRQLDNLFARMESPSLRSDFLEAMQAAGVVHRDVELVIAVADVGMRQRAAHLGEQICAEDGVGTAIALIEQEKFAPKERSPEFR